MDEDSFNIAVRKFLKVVGITSQREIERVVREGKIEGTKLKLRMTLTAENTPLNHVVEETIEASSTGRGFRGHASYRLWVQPPGSSR